MLDTALEDHPVAEDLQAMVRASKWDQVLKRTATMFRHTSLFATAPSGAGFFGEARRDQADEVIV